MNKIKEVSKHYFDKVKDSDWKGNVGLALQGTAAVIDLGFRFVNSMEILLRFLKDFCM